MKVQILNPAEGQDNVIDLNDWLNEKLLPFQETIDTLHKENQAKLGQIETLTNELNAALIAQENTNATDISTNSQTILTFQTTLETFEKTEQQRILQLQEIQDTFSTLNSNIGTNSQALVEILDRLKLDEESAKIRDLEIEKFIEIFNQNEIKFTEFLKNQKLNVTKIKEVADSVTTFSESLPFKLVHTEKLTEIPNLTLAISTSGVYFKLNNNLHTIWQKK